MKFFTTVSTVSAINPLSKTISMMQTLVSEVKSEGVAEDKAYGDYADWCHDTKKDTGFSIDTGNTKSEQLNALIEKEAANMSNSQARVEELLNAISHDENDLTGATQVRNTEHKDYLAANAEAAETVSAISRAHSIIKKTHNENSFVQKDSEQYAVLIDSLTVLIQGTVVSSNNKEKIQSFLQDDFMDKSAPVGETYESHSGNILSVLDEMKEAAEDAKNEATKTEMNEKHSFEMLKQDLTTSIAQEQKELKSTQNMLSTSTEAHSQGTGDLEVSNKGIKDDKSYLAEVTQGCNIKATDYETSKTGRSDELIAINKAIEILNEKTVGAEKQNYGLLEISAETKASDIVIALRKMNEQFHDPALALLSQRVNSAQRTASDPFVKVRKLINDMIKKLKEEQGSEATHKAFCDKEISESKTTISKHTNNINKLTARKDKTDSAISKLKDEISTLQGEVIELHSKQSEMNGIRKEENDDFKQAKTDYTAGIEGLEGAIQVLKEYYSQDDSFVQQPSVEFHAASSDKAGGILGFLDVILSDFTKSLTSETVSEQTAVNVYEKTTHQQNVLIKEKDTAVKYKSTEVTNANSLLSDTKEDYNGVSSELDAVEEYYTSIKKQCTAIPMSHEEKQAKRKQEIDGLKQALQILSADKSFLALRTISKHN